MLYRTSTALCALLGLATISQTAMAFNALASTNVVNYWGQKYDALPSIVLCGTSFSMIWSV